MAQQPSDANRAKEVGPRDSTAELPMFDLETALSVVETIREKAVETAPLAAVAKALNYANATSTPFYRRLTSARLFGLLSGKAALTQQAIDYIKPHDEQMKARVVVEAITGIPGYRDLIDRYAGKKINIELVANSIEKKMSLTHSCALVCAKAFESSLRFAGLLSSDGVVQTAPATGLPEKPTIPSEAKGAESATPPDKNFSTGGADTQQHTLFLDKGKVRTFSFAGPVEVTPAEYERICAWLKVTMIVMDTPKGESQ